MNLMVAIPTFIAALSWISVVIWYHTRAKWWKNVIGRNTMLVSAVIAWVFIRLSFRHIFPEMTWTYETSGMITYLVASYAGLRRVYLIERAQREGDRRKIV